MLLSFTLELGEDSRLVEELYEEVLILGLNIRQQGHVPYLTPQL
jgi:hypothetical protein